MHQGRVPGNGSIGVSMLFNPSKKFRRVVAVEETVIGLKGHRLLHMDLGERG